MRTLYITKRGNAVCGDIAISAEEAFAMLIGAPYSSDTGTVDYSKIESASYEVMVDDKLVEVSVEFVEQV